MSKRKSVNDKRVIVEELDIEVDFDAFEGTLYQIRHRLKEVEARANAIDPSYTEISLGLEWNPSGYDGVKVYGQRPETDKEVEKRKEKKKEENKKKKTDKEVRRRKDKALARELLKRFPELLEEGEDEEELE